MGTNPSTQFHMAMAHEPGGGPYGTGGGDDPGCLVLCETHRRKPIGCTTRPARPGGVWPARARADPTAACVGCSSPRRIPCARRASGQPGHAGRQYPVVLWLVSYPRKRVGGGHPGSSHGSTTSLAERSRCSHTRHCIVLIVRCTRYVAMGGGSPPLGGDAGGVGTGIVCRPAPATMSHASVRLPTLQQVVPLASPGKHESTHTHIHICNTTVRGWGEVGFGERRHRSSGPSRRQTTCPGMQGTRTPVSSNRRPPSASPGVMLL